MKIGGSNPISVQSMTNALTKLHVKSTINQINEIIEAGADLVRVSCPDEESTSALKEIVKSTDIPTIAIYIFIIKEQLSPQRMELAVLELIQVILVIKIILKKLLKLLKIIIVQLEVG